MHSFQSPSKRIKTSLHSLGKHSLYFNGLAPDPFNSSALCDHMVQRDLGTSLAVQWLGLRTSAAGGMGSISGRGTKILHAAGCSQKNKSRTKTKQKKKTSVLPQRDLAFLNMPLTSAWPIILIQHHNGSGEQEMASTQEPC